MQHLIINLVINQLNRLTPNDPYMGRTAQLTSKRCTLYIYSTNIGTEYFKHALYSPFFSLQNAACFIMLTCLVPVLSTFYIHGVLKLKKNNSGAKGLKCTNYFFIMSLLYASICFEHCVLIIRRSKLYYTASGIITPVGDRPVHSPLSTCAPDDHLQVRWYQMLYNTILTSWWWVHSARNI